MPKVVYYRDLTELGRLWRYRVIADNNEIVHASHKGWLVIDDARVHLWALREALYFFDELLVKPQAFAESQRLITLKGPKLIFRLDNSADWRWSITLAQSIDTHLSNAHEGFKNKADAVHNARLVGNILRSDYNEIVDPS